jgi:ElaB/YqjD/DUF883 family membrane-anchored ribosome-binding protein
MDETTEQNVQRETNTIKGDAQKLRDDLSALLGDVTAYSREKLADTGGRVSAAVDAFRGRAAGRMQETARTTKTRGRHFVDASRKAVRQNPLVSAVAALGAGLLLSSFCRCKKK